jgi:heat shock protein HtpX
MKREMFSEVSRNKRNSILLIGIFLALIVGLGFGLGAIWGNFYFGGILAAIIAVIYTLIMFNTGDQTILSISKAKRVKKNEYPHLFHTVEGLTIAAGLPKTPKTYVIEDSALNAFATGKDPEHASIAVTTGLLNKLNRQELEGVIAHEMSHIKNYDIRLMMLAAVLVGIVVLLSDLILRSLWFSGGRGRDRGNAGLILIIIGLVLAILAPIAVHLVKLSISRKREYAADANGAILTRYPEGLASALEKIQHDPDPLVDGANRATAHLFISTPFKGKKKSAWWSTHPPISSRIKRLREM